MKPGFFIDRPVFSTVLSILIVIVGIIGLALLPVDQYPQITPPVVKISATYPGASALTVSQAVATPIEQELNGTPGMIYMQSSSSNSGSLNITVTFDARRYCMAISRQFYRLARTLPQAIQKPRAACARSLEVCRRP